MKPINPSAPQRPGWRVGLVLASAALAMIVATGGCGGSSPSKSESPASTSTPTTAVAPTKSSAPAAPAGFAADLTFSGVINGHVTEARAASSKIFTTPCTPYALHVGVTVDGHGYTLSAGSFDESTVRLEDVFLIGEDTRDNYKGSAGKVTFKTKQSALFDVQMNGTGNTETSQTVHVSGSASC